MDDGRGTVLWGAAAVESLVPGVRYGVGGGAAGSPSPGIEREGYNP